MRSEIQYMLIVLLLKKACKSAGESADLVTAMWMRIFKLYDLISFLPNLVSSF